MEHAGRDQSQGKRGARYIRELCDEVRRPDPFGGWILVDGPHNAKEAFCVEKSEGPYTALEEDFRTLKLSSEHGIHLHRAAALTNVRARVCAPALRSPPQCSAVACAARRRPGAEGAAQQVVGHCHWAARRLRRSSCGTYPATALWRLALRHPRRALGAMTTSHSCAPQAYKYYVLYRS